MFTGIVEEVGTVLSFARSGDKARLVIKASVVLDGTRLGDSINIDGVCQTVTSLPPGAFAVDTLAESLKKTTLGGLTAGSRVNLERALRMDSRLGGHIVQGHVGASVPIKALRNVKDNVYLTVEVPPGLVRFCVPEGSIALDGISLTIASIAGTEVTINIIPATIDNTTLRYKRAGDLMNLETDVLGRYVESLLFPRRRASVGDGELSEPGYLVGDGGLSAEKLRELGY